MLQKQNPTDYLLSIYQIMPIIEIIERIIICRMIQQQIYSKLMNQLNWCIKGDNNTPIIKAPLHFMFPPVQQLSKELTRLNSNHQYRISYLGPRWQNSVTFHKKYSSNGSYEFDEKRVNKNNNFLQDTMSHNQYYKNQIYYRAFQGMNPTINLKQELVFQSRFQSGNLDCVVKVKQDEYDLFLRIDSNTRGNISWFYFSVSNGRDKKIKFNICNLTKGNTHYARGLNPFMYTSNTKHWSQEGTNNVVFVQKKLRYEFLYEKIRDLGPFYQLSFEVDFNYEEFTKFAYCIPYTYSDLTADLRLLSTKAQVGVLGQSLTGINIPILFFGKHQPENLKPVILITGRIHPGETNSSLILSNFMKQLAFSPQAQYLREKVLTIIVPMINPDGVILGNSRTGASGKDLNRQFKTKNHSLFPQVVLLKKLVNKITQTHILDIYLDFHGHSCKKNVFMFGPNYNISQSQYYKCRVFPKILSNITPIFRYYSCSYDIPSDKKATARSVMLNEMLIPFVYTIQSSLGFYYDVNLHKILPFDRQKWEQLGENILLALKEYRQGVEQMEIFMRQKKRIRQEARHSSANGSHMILSKNKKRQQNKQLSLNQIQILKIYQQIREIQQKKSKQIKKQRQSDEQSDSHDQKEDLQKQKMYQFTQMVTQFVQQQNKNKRFSSLEEQKKSEQKNDRFVDQKSKKNRLLLLKKRKQNKKAEQQLFAQLSEIKYRSKRSQIKTQNKCRKVEIKDLLERQYLQVQRSQMFSHQVKRQCSIQNNLSNSQQTAKKSQSKLSQIDLASVDKKTNRLNINMFNFSKMIQNPDSSRYQQHRSPHSLKHILPKRYQKIFQGKTKYHKKQISNTPQIKNKQSYINMYQVSQMQENDIYKQEGKSLEYVSNKNTTQQLKLKQKIRLPTNFYRIKYYNLQKKNENKKKNLQELNQLNRIQLLHKNSQKFSACLHISNLQLRDKDSPFWQMVNQQQKGLYAKINQFPIL